MAKRKRLSPASSAFLEAAPETKSAFGPALRAAPIADVARETAASAAVEELSQALSDARSSGRMVVSISLDQIELHHLVRDRIGAEDDEMQALVDSLRARGQQTPIEVEELADGRYGLISGWRRCAALSALHKETSDARFGEVLCLVRQPAEQADAYLAMVEENEVRAGLSYFERARIVAKSVEQGVFDSDRTALQTLFQSASRSKRSKIGSFLGVVRALDDVLRFPQTLGERQGLQLSRALSEDDGLAKTLHDALSAAAPARPEDESAVLAAALATPPQPKAAPAQTTEPVAGGVRLRYKEGELVLEGRAVTDALKTQLIAWLRQTL